MASQERGGGALPKFGEWDVKNPASAEGFTAIFNKARDEKKTKNTTSASPRINYHPVPSVISTKKDVSSYGYQTSPKRKWLCCGSISS